MSARGRLTQGRRRAYPSATEVQHTALLRNVKVYISTEKWEKVKAYAASADISKRGAVRECIPRLVQLIEEEHESIGDILRVMENLVCFDTPDDETRRAALSVIESRFSASMGAFFDGLVRQWRESRAHGLERTGHAARWDSVVADASKRNGNIAVCVIVGTIHSLGDELAAEFAKSLEEPLLLYLRTMFTYKDWTIRLDTQTVPDSVEMILDVLRQYPPNPDSVVRKAEWLIPEICKCLYTQAFADRGESMLQMLLYFSELPAVHHVFVDASIPKLLIRLLAGRDVCGMVGRHVIKIVNNLCSQTHIMISASGLDERLAKELLPYLIDGMNSMSTVSVFDDISIGMVATFNLLTLLVCTQYPMRGCECLARLKLVVPMRVFNSGHLVGDCSSILGTEVFESMQTNCLSLLILYVRHIPGAIDQIIRARGARGENYLWRMIDSGMDLSEKNQELLVRFLHEMLQEKGDDVDFKQVLFENAAIDFLQYVIERSQQPPVVIQAAAAAIRAMGFSA